MLRVVPTPSIGYFDDANCQCYLWFLQRCAPFGRTSQFREQQDDNMIHTMHTYCEGFQSEVFSPTFIMAKCRNSSCISSFLVSEPGSYGRDFVSYNFPGQLVWHSGILG